MVDASFAERLLQVVVGTGVAPRVLAVATPTAQPMPLPGAWAAERHSALDVLQLVTRPGLSGDLVIDAPWVRLQDAVDLRAHDLNLLLPARALLPDVLLALAATTAEPGTRITAVVPAATSRTPTSAVSQLLRGAATPKVIIDGGRRTAEALGIDARVDVHLLQLVAGPPEHGHTVHLAQLDRMADAEDEDVLHQVSLLLRTKGGEHPVGWVLRHAIPTDEPLDPAFHAPERRARHNQLRRAGEVVRLESLVEVVPSVRRDLHGAEGPAENLRLVTGRAIGRSGDFDLDACEVRSGPLPRQAVLRPGDLVVRALQVPVGGALAASAVPPHEGPPLLASHDVLSLRFIADVPDATRQIVTAFLRSPHASKLLEGTGSGPRLTIRALLRLEVLLPDATLREVLSDLQHDEQRLSEWLDEVRATRRALLQDESLQRSLLQVSEAGRLVRQRVAAAERMSQMSGRVQAFMPYPLALLWRGVSTSRPDDSGYLQALQCGEAVACYLAAMGLLLARAVDVHDIGRLANLRTQFEAGKRGMSMGDWVDLAKEVSSNKEVDARVDDRSPFVEIKEAMAGGAVVPEALEALKDLRDDHAHGRGPRGKRSVQAAFDEAVQHLLRLYAGIEWLSRYPLRLVESTAWDSVAQQCSVTYRELIGDHHLVQQRQERRPTPHIDAHRLHCVDQHGDLHLIDPLLTMRECDECHIPSIFALNGWSKTEDITLMRALDHNHLVRSSAFSAGLREFGLLPARRE